MLAGPKRATLRARWLWLSLVLGTIAATAGAAAEAPVRLKVVGGLGGLTQYRLEEAFWTDAVTRLSGGRIEAALQPLDGGGLRSQEMLRLLKLGVVPFGTALIAVAASEEPELNAIDLPGQNPDIAALRRTVDLYRDRLRELLHERYGVELLGVYTYPAQVLFCRRRFGGLDDLAGLRVRTSSVGQSEMMAALDAVPVKLAFAEVVPAMKAGAIDCAITGTLSGNEIGLADATTHVHGLAISWGVSFFGANKAVWDALPAGLRAVLRNGIGELETRIWARAAQDTELGLACNAGVPSCPADRRRAMTVVATSPADIVRRDRLLRDFVIPRWIERCGELCAQAWHRHLASTPRTVAQGE